MTGSPSPFPRSHLSGAPWPDGRPGTQVVQLMVMEGGGARQEEERKGWQECVERGDELF